MWISGRKFRQKPLVLFFLLFLFLCLYDRAYDILRHLEQHILHSHFVDRGKEHPVSVFVGQFFAYVLRKFFDFQWIGFIIPPKSSCISTIAYNAQETMDLLYAIVDNEDGGILS